MAPGSAHRFHRARSLADACAALADLGGEGVPLAGGTWLMRAPLRGEPAPRVVVALADVDALKGIAVSDDTIDIGACVTHAELARALGSLPEVRVLAQAAGLSANPAIREMATVGGNLCTAGFAAADLVPALLCLDAAVDLAGPDGSERLPLAAFLERRHHLPSGCLLHRVILPRSPRRSAHARLPLRRAGDYPVAIVSLAVTLDGADCIASVRLAIGSVEAVSRRWERLEGELLGRPLDPVAAAALAAAADDIAARDGVEAPGWYRRAVLPTLVRRAVEAVRS